MRTARLPLMPSSMVQKIIGMIAAHLALVDHARQPAGARQHREQRHFRQRHRRRAVVGEDDVIGRERELVAAAGRGAVDDGDETLAGILDESSRPLRVSLVNLQKLTLWAWVAPASMRMLAPAQNTRFLPERITTTFTCRDARSAAAAPRRPVRCRRRDRRNSA